MNQNALSNSPAKFKGDFCNGALDFGWDKLSKATKVKKRAIETASTRTLPVSAMPVQSCISSGSNPFASKAARQALWKYTELQLVCSDHFVTTPLPLKIPDRTWLSMLWKG